jgi:hypothetical protein
MPFPRFDARNNITANDRVSRAPRAQAAGVTMEREKR